MKQTIKQKQINNCVTLGIDSSTTNCGVAFFKNGTLEKTQNYEFTGTYDLSKLYAITASFNCLFREVKPDFVIIEEPINVRNRRIAMALNQVAGAIASVAFINDADVSYLHNLTAKKVFNVKKSKENANRVMREMFPELAHATEHECDAVMLVEAYKKLFVS